MKINMSQIEDLNDISEKDKIFIYKMLRLSNNLSYEVDYSGIQDYKIFFTWTNKGDKTIGFTVEKEKAAYVLYDTYTYCMYAEMNPVVPVIKNEDDYEKALKEIMEYCKDD